MLKMVGRNWEESQFLALGLAFQVQQQLQQVDSCSFAGRIALAAPCEYFDMAQNYRAVDTNENTCQEL